MKQARPLVLLVSLVAACAGPPPEPPEHHEHGPIDDAATIHHRFEDPEVWAQRFENPDRDDWQRPSEVLGWLSLPERAVVADIGAATGYFPVRFARALPEGRVYGVDVEPTLVNYLNLRARRERLYNLIALVAATDDPRLPEPVDLLFLCNTYHHIDERVAYFGALRDRLREGGRLAVIDYLVGDLPVGPPPGAKIAPEAVIEELDRAGYRLVRRERLPYQFFLLFAPAEAEERD